MSEPKFHEGQVVKIKSYAELKDNQLNILYTDENLKEMADAEVAIYKVLNDAGIILRYQVGQWGRNIVEIPEAYIKGDVSIGIDGEPGAKATFQTNDILEFSNQLIYAVRNGQSLCVPNRIVVVNQGDQEIAPEILQQIADEQNVPVSELTVLTKEMYDTVMRNAMLCPQVPDAKTLKELHIRDNMTVPELTLCFNERDDSRPWYARFDKKRKGRR